MTARDVGPILADRIKDQSQRHGMSLRFPSGTIRYVIARAAKTKCQTHDGVDAIEAAAVATYEALARLEQCALEYGDAGHVDLTLDRARLLVTEAACCLRDLDVVRPGPTPVVAPREEAADGPSRDP